MSNSFGNDTTDALAAWNSATTISAAQAALAAWFLAVNAAAAAANTPVDAIPNPPVPTNAIQAAAMTQSTLGLLTQDPDTEVLVHADTGVALTPDEINTFVEHMHSSPEINWWLIGGAAASLLILVAFISSSKAMKLTINEVRP